MLRSLRSSRLITPRIFFDATALGLIQYEVHLAIPCLDDQLKEKLFSELSDCEHTLWFAQTQGSYNVALSLCGHSSRLTLHTLNECLERVEVVPSRLSVGVLASYTVYRKKYLAQLGSEKNSLSDTLQIQSTTDYTCDALDLRIISALFKSSQASIRNVAREAGIPRTTFEYRMERLKEKGVISNRCFIIDPQKLGILRSRLLIQTQNFDARSREKFMSYCSIHPNIVSLRHILGEWDYELTLESESPQMAKSIHDEITSVFPGQIQQTEVLDVTRLETPASFLEQT